MQTNKLFAAVVAANLAVVPMLTWAQEGNSTDEVVVTASLTERDSATSPAFTTVITSEEIAKAPVNGLADLLRETVGVNNATDNTGRDQVSIRGLGGRYTLMLVNGKRVSSSGALWRGGDFDFSSIPLGSIERVEIVRGPMSALYGSDAIGGVVNIITKKPTEDWVGQVTAEYRGVSEGDGGDQQRVSASASGAVSDAVGLSISGELTDRDAWVRNLEANPVPSLEEKKTASLVTTTSIRLDEQQSLDVDLKYINDKRPRGLFYYSVWQGTAYPSYREQEIENFTYGLTHKGDWDGFKTVAFIQQEDSTIDDYNTNYEEDSLQRRVKEKNTYAKFYAVTEVGAHSLIGGVDYRNQVIEDPIGYFQTGETETRGVALFAQDEIKLTEKLNLTLGGRVDDHEVFGDHTSPKIYLTYEAADGVVIKGGASDAYKAPDAYQLSKGYRVVSCGGSCYIPGNPDLVPETSTNYEAGVAVNKAGWNLSVVAFSNDVEDMIVAGFSAAGAREWQNLSRAKTKGIELDASVDLNESISLAANVTKLDAKNVDSSGKETKLESRPETQGNISVDWHATDSFTTGLAAHYTGAQFYSGKDLPSYTRLDWTSSYDLTKALVLRAGVKNLTNVDLTEKDPTFLYQELGRNYYLSATYNF